MTEPNLNRHTATYSILELVLIVGLACVPLFATFPYRVNIFLSWEGAYRLAQGQMPYRDFGMPLGYMFWVVPALFMKMFGVQMITLVKAQFFINILSGLAFRSILKSLQVQPGVRLLTVLLYCLSFSFFNFWPWYNHTVIVYEFVALAFLLRAIFRPMRYNWLWLAGSALFVFFSFFTKQDGGGMAVLLCSGLLVCHCLYERRWQPLLIFFGSLAVIAFIGIYPFTKYNFAYWFNHGQPPHTARVAPFDIVSEFLGQSQWIKFYLFFTVLLAFTHFKSWRAFFSNKISVFFLLLTLGILLQASILQITSYTPPDNNIYYHSFAVAFILTHLVPHLSIDLNRLRPLLLCAFGLLLWWSGTYWNYFQRVVKRALPASTTRAKSGENVVNRHTYKIDLDTTGEIPQSKWKFSKLKTLHRIYMPEPTVQGVERLLNMDLLKSGKPLRVLNMTELTPLAAEVPFELEHGPGQPLWYHLGVAMFNREAELFEARIRNKEYDLVLFEHIPSLNNFYPFRVRDVLQQQYQKVDSFAAPRRGETRGTIEVYTR